MESPTTRSRVTTDIDAEMLAVKRIRRQLEDLKSPRSRIRALNYVLDALREEEHQACEVIRPPPAPSKQLTIEDAVVAKSEDDLFGENAGG